MKSSEQPVRKTGILINPEKAGAGQMLSQVCTWLAGCGTEILVQSRWRSICNHARFLSEKRIVADADAVIVIGGDGTILRAGRLMSSRPVPMMGINLGHLGFLATVSPRSAKRLVKRLCAGKFDVESRPFLKARAGKGKISIAVNELLFRPKSKSRMAVFELALNGRNVLNFRGDGLIVSSPTGSTAHSLSAGGPIVSPAVQGILITPVSPHLLSSRPLVVPTDTLVRVTSVGQHPGMMMSSDGQKSQAVAGTTGVEISAGRQALRFVVFDRAEYYRILTRKLGWGFKVGEGK